MIYQRGDRRVRRVLRGSNYYRVFLAPLRSLCANARPAGLGIMYSSRKSLRTFISACNGVPYAAVAMKHGDVTVHVHVCMSVPFALFTIAETFHVPITALVFVYDAAVTLLFV